MKKKKYRLLLFTLLFLAFFSYVMTNQSFLSLAQDYDSDAITPENTILVEGDIIQYEITTPPANLDCTAYFYVNETCTDKLNDYAFSFESGNSYTFGPPTMYENASYPIESGYRFVGWKLKNKVAHESDSGHTWNFYRVVEKIPTFHITVDYNVPNDSTSKFEYDLAADAPIPLEFPTRSGYTIFQWKDKDNTTYTPEEMQNLKATADNTYTADWIMEVPGDKVLRGDGPYELLLNTPYTSGLGSEFRVNGGSDGCNYSNGVAFYVAADGRYSFGN